MNLRTILREIVGLALFFWAAFLAVCVLSYALSDPTLNQIVPKGYAIKNLAGLVGAHIGGLLVEFFGLGALAWPVLCLYLAVCSFFGLRWLAWWRWIGFLLLTLTLMTVAEMSWARHALAFREIRGGGMFGASFHLWSINWLKPTGTALLWGYLFLTSLLLSLGIPLMTLPGAVALRLKGWWRARQERDTGKASGDAPRPVRANVATHEGPAKGRFGLGRMFQREAGEEPPGAALKAGLRDLYDRMTITDGPAPTPTQEPASSPQPSAATPGPSSDHDDLPPAPWELDAEAMAQPNKSMATAPLTGMAAETRPATPARTVAVAPPPPAGSEDEDLVDNLPELLAQDETTGKRRRLRDALSSLGLPKLGRKGKDTPEATSPAHLPGFLGHEAQPAAVSQANPATGGDLPFFDAGEPGQAPGAQGDRQETRPFDSVEPEAQPEEPVTAVDQGPHLPGLDLLAPAADTVAPADQAYLEQLAQSVVSCLADFGVRGEVSHIVPGPVVTMFEFKPAPGVKISRISSLSDDLALALKALAVRIEAIPGKDTVGIEIPNAQRQMVSLREILASATFQEAESPLTLALGKDIRGVSFVADLARMPHLLVAGATGAGKSVCLNAIILSLLYKASPDQVKLLLIDPKRIELSLYRALPHLIHPVVAEMTMAKSALEWAVYEMDKRYEAMARLGARNIDGYAQKLANLDLAVHPELADLVPMPYLVIIIDELADLMMTAGKEAEMAIVRLAQLARAAGIHLILATQRPSVDVVTGLIKANFPTRIAFQVTSKHDSRTILDTNGAEYLLGRGDSLFKPSGGKLLRLHGAYVAEEEIGRVIDFWKREREQSFGVDFAEWGEQAKGDNGDSDMVAGGLDGDETYQEAVEFVLSQGRTSISLLQRRFRIGFNRAARYIEQMEKDGLVGPQDGVKPRMVIKSD